MKEKLINILEQETNLGYIENNKVLYGKYKEYYTYIQSLDDLAFAITFSLKLSEAYTINNINLVLSNISKEYSNIKSCSYTDNSVKIRYAYKTSKKENADNILAILNTLVQEASLNSLSTCCPICGENVEISPFVINGHFTACCDNCKLLIKIEIVEKQESIKNTKSNVIAGTVGAILGSLIGVALWIIVGLAGYIAAICGLVLAICTIKGYQLFGGKLDKKGMTITIVITILMIFVSQYLSLVFDIYNSYKTGTIFDAIKLAPKVLTIPKISKDFYYNLGLGYFFTLIASVSLFKNSYKQANYKFEVD